MEQNGSDLGSGSLSRIGWDLLWDPLPVSTTFWTTCTLAVALLTFLTSLCFGATRGTLFRTFSWQRADVHQLREIVEHLVSLPSQEALYARPDKS